MRWLRGIRQRWRDSAGNWWCDYWTEARSWNESGSFVLAYAATRAEAVVQAEEHIRSCIRFNADVKYRLERVGLCARIREALGA